jgi:hypothetical protein
VDFFAGDLVAADLGFAAIVLMRGNQGVGFDDERARSGGCALWVVPLGFVVGDADSLRE